MARGVVDRSPGFYNRALETMKPEERLRFLRERLQESLRHTVHHTAHFAKRLEAGGLPLEQLTEPADLTRLPVLRKRDLPALDAAAPPFGGLAAVPARPLRRLFISPGPIYEPEGAGPDYWRMARAMYAAGFRKGDVALNTFGYHLTPGGRMCEEGLAIIGCVVIPMGGGNTDIQVQVLRDVQATGYVGTPSFLETILRRAEEMGIAPLNDLSLEVALVSGGMLADSLRTLLRERYGVRVSQAYASADLGLIAYECPERRGMHVAEDLLLDITDPGTGQPVPDGTPGEVVVTTFNPLYPLIRFGTGDLSVLECGACACGRSTPRLTRMLGRSDDAVKARGTFLYPGQVDAVLAGNPEITRYQLVVRRHGFEDDLVLRVESSSGPGDLPARLEPRLREATKLRVRVEVVPAGAIPPEAKKVSDERTWD